MPYGEIPVPPGNWHQAPVPAALAAAQSAADCASVIGSPFEYVVTFKFSLIHSLPPIVTADATWAFVIVDGFIAKGDLRFTKSAAS